MSKWGSTRLCVLVNIWILNQSPNNNLYLYKLAWISGTLSPFRCQLFHWQQTCFCVCKSSVGDIVNPSILNNTTLNLCQPVWVHVPYLSPGSTEQLDWPGSHLHCRGDWYQFFDGAERERLQPSQGRHHKLEMRYTGERKINIGTETLAFWQVFETSFDRKINISLLVPIHYVAEMKLQVKRNILNEGKVLKSNQVLVWQLPMWLFWLNPGLEVSPYVQYISEQIKLRFMDMKDKKKER